MLTLLSADQQRGGGTIELQARSIVLRIAFKNHQPWHFELINSADCRRDIAYLIEGRRRSRCLDNKCLFHRVPRDEFLNKLRLALRQVAGWL